MPDLQTVLGAVQGDLTEADKEAITNSNTSCTHYILNKHFLQNINKSIQFCSIFCCQMFLFLIYGFCFLAGQDGASKEVLEKAVANAQTPVD